MRCSIDPDQVSAGQPNDDEDIEQIEANGRDNEQVHGGDVWCVVAGRCAIPGTTAVALGLAAASAAVVKPAAAQTTGHKDATPRPGVVVRAYDGETPSLIPGFKTVSMRDVIMQPGSKTMAPPMENAMVCHITEGELRVEQEGKTFTAKKDFVWTCNKDTKEQAFNDGQRRCSQSP